MKQHVKSLRRKRAGDAAPPRAVASRGCSGESRQPSHRGVPDARGSVRRTLAEDENSARHAALAAACCLQLIDRHDPS